MNSIIKQLREGIVHHEQGLQEAKDLLADVNKGVMYLARDKDGTLCLWLVKPTKHLYTNEVGYVWDVDSDLSDHTLYMELPTELYPMIKWESGLVKVLLSTREVL